MIFFGFRVRDVSHWIRIEILHLTIFEKYILENFVFVGNDQISKKVPLGPHGPLCGLMGPYWALRDPMGPYWALWDPMGPYVYRLNS